VSRGANTRYPHAFSKGRGVPLVSEGSWRGGPRDPRRVQTQNLARPMSEAAKAAPARDDPRRWKYLKVSPTIADLYRSHAGVAVVCADCLHGVGHRNPGLPDHFKRQWRLTLLEIEKKCRCAMCGSRNARVYPWWGGTPGAVELQGPGPEGGR
jgi:hypothetical protein